MEPSETTIPVLLPNGARLHVIATLLPSLRHAERSGESEISGVLGKIASLSEIRDAIEGVTQLVTESLANAKPKSASVEFGIEVGLESGQITALLVKGDTKANLKITLNW